MNPFNDYEVRLTLKTDAEEITDVEEIVSDQVFEVLGQLGFTIELVEIEAA